MGKQFTILGVESSCDETGVALYCSRNGLLGHQLYSQLSTHAKYGGVVPELASRDHIRKITPLLKQLQCDTDTRLADIDAIAYTAGPGLMGSLFVGASFSMALAEALGIPTIPVHHLEGHLLAPLMETPQPPYPFIALLVSGGHTQLIAVRQYRHYELLGESLDDAAGEAFDKAAKMLGLAYPGGPALAKLADQVSTPEYAFPRPMTNKPGLDFSFSGLKTYTRNAIEKKKQADGQVPANEKAQIAAAFQKAVVDTLTIKCRRAVQQTGISTLVLSGGVAANQSLRQSLMALEGVDCFYPKMEFCTDNGAMIAFAGYCAFHYLGEKSIETDRSISVKPRWPIMDLVQPSHS